MSITPKRSHRDSIVCGTCGCVLGNQRYIRCCRCPSFNQCLACASIGLEKDRHLRVHPFFVVEPSETPIYREGWEGSDEISLLCAIQMFGIGNWHEISKWMRKKTALQVETHYMETYIRPPSAPLPGPTILPEEELPPPPPYDTRPVESCPSEAHEKNMMMRQKREKTTPAEYSGYMPYRHEFEIDFNNDAESIVAGIRFSDDDNPDTFQFKITSLLSYNSQLEERRFRTRIIEDMKIQYREVRSGKDKEVSTRFLNGCSPQEQRIDEKLMTLAPYCGADFIERFAGEIHRRLRVMDCIRDRRLWRDNGVRSHQEGQLFNALVRMLKDGKVAVSEIDNWNDKIVRYEKRYERDAVREMENLSQPERDLCTAHKVEPQLFLAIKNLLIREYAFKESLSRQAAQNLCPEMRTLIGVIYDLFLTLGWVRE